MEMTVETIGDGVTKVNLAGLFDIQGAQQIDLQFNVITGNQRHVIVDLERVSFLASMGIRALMIGAKTLKSKGGRMALLKPILDVEKVLVSCGTDMIIPIVHDLNSAIRLVSA